MVTKQWVRYVSMTVVAVLAGMAAPVAAQANAAESSSAALADGWYRLVNGNSRKVLGVAGASKDNGAKVVQYPSVTKEGQQIPDQSWLAVPRGGGVYSLRNAATDTWKAMAVAGHSHANGGKIVQYTYNGDWADQQWAFIRVVGDGIPWDTFMLQSLNTSEPKCLAIPADSKANGVQAVQYDCHVEWKNQWWEFQRVA